MAKNESQADTYITVDELFIPLRAIAAKKVKNMAALEIVLMIDQTVLWHHNLHTLKTTVLENIRHTKKRLNLSKLQLNRFLELSNHTKKSERLNPKDKKKKEY